MHTLWTTAGTFTREPFGSWSLDQSILYSLYHDHLKPSSNNSVHLHAKTWLMTTLSRLLGVLCLEMYRVSKSAFKSHMTIIRPHHGILYCVDSKKFLRDCYHCKLFAFVYSSTNKNLVINWTQGLMKNYCVFWEKEIYKP